MENLPTSAAAAHIVIVYPQTKDIATVLELAKSLDNSLTRACGAAPVQIRPDVTVLCLLSHGRLEAISRAVDDVTDAYSRWLVLPVGTPHEASGLSTADLWVRRHC